MIAALAVALALVVALALRSWSVGRALRELAARTAHEVRGPLTAAQLALHGAARRGEVAPLLVAGLELELRRAALALEDPHGRGGASDAEADLLELLRCQASTWREVAAAHGARIVLVPGPGAVVVRADALRVAQATANVVTNAIEHGGGLIEIRTRADGDRVRIEVTDGGPGLPAPVADLARRPRAGRGRRGRGLAIASRVAGRCGGRLCVLPSPRGARVAIELPLAQARP